MWCSGFAPRFTFINFAVALLIFCASDIAQGQTASHIREPQRNFTSAGAFSLSDFESINTTNGNLILRFALGQLPPGRSGLRGGFYLQYNSKLYNTTISPALDIDRQVSLQNLLQNAIDGGWHFRSRYELIVANRNNEIDGGYEQAAINACNSTGSSTVQNELATFIWKVKMLFPDGSEHIFRPSGYTDGRGDGYFNVDTSGHEAAFGCSWPPGASGCSCSHTEQTDPNPVRTYYTADGSYLRLTIVLNQGWTLYYPDGSKVVDQGTLQRVYNRNGSYYDINGDTITDDAGRSVSHTSDAATGDDLITQTGVGGAPLVWRIKWKSISGDRGYMSTAAVSEGERGNPSVQQWTIGFRVVDKIILPEQLGGLSYTFDYDTTTAWGEVSSITLPADATETPPQVTYQYTYPDEFGTGLPKCTNILRGYVSTKTLTWHDQADGATTSISEAWSYSVNDTVTYITAPDGGVTIESHGNTSIPASDTGLLESVERPDGSKTERIWEVNPQPWLGTPPTMSERNAFVKTEFNSVKDAGGNYAKTAIKDFVYDKNGNVLQITEYDWVDYSLVPRNSFGVITGVPDGLTPGRVILNTYNNQTPDFSTPGNHPNAYWNVAPPGGYTTLALNVIASKEIRATSGGAVQARTEYTYDNPATTANLTVTRTWDSKKGPLRSSLPLLDASNSIAVTNQYGAYSTGATGKLIRAIDANGVATSYAYGDIGNGAADLYVTKTIMAEGTAISSTSESKYDFYTGAVTEAKDTDNSVITKMTLDVVGRPILIQRAWGISGQETRRSIEYSDTLRRIITRSDLSTTGDGKLITIQHYDQLGRIRLTRSLESGNPADATDETKGIKLQTRYFAGDAGNQNGYQLISAPYRSETSGAAGGEPGMAWNRSKFDKGGRVIELETFAGATPPAPWGGNSASSGKVTTEYDAEFTIATDQAGKKRRSETDALGRLTRVTEDPDPGGLNYDTYYSYDALGNLLQVAQGSQTRTFTYDSMSRVTSATNPESGPVTYTYDANGNLIERIDARGVKTTMTYDELNRVKSKSYAGTPSGGTEEANATPPVNYFYDDYSTLPSGAPTWPGTPSKGRLIGVTYGSGSEGTYYSYDAAGRITTNHQRQGTSNYATRYTYNLAGGVTLEQRGNYLNNVWTDYFRNSWTYDNAGRISGMAKSKTPFQSFTTLATNISYTPSGELQSETYGNGLIHSIGYNERQQPTEIRLGRPDNLESVFTIYSMYGTANNVNDQDAEINLAQNDGNIARIRYSVSGTIQYTQTFQYDALNRLGYAVEHNNGTYNDAARAWYQTFDYDPYGNRGINVANTSDNVDGANTALQLSDFSAANNRITRAGSVYDAAGNLIAERGNSYTYDGENRLVTAIVTAGATSQYVYDGNGRRVKKIVGGVGTRFEYGASGELIAERNDATGAVTKGYCYKGGVLLATTTNGTSYEYATADHLGSPRAWTDGSGNLVAGGRHDYLPFGEELFAGYGMRTTGQGYAANAQTDGQRKQFGSKERDTETGLDFFGARYFSSTQGRFTSDDPLNIPALQRLKLKQFAKIIANPANWNGYAYAHNNPLSKIDPDGFLTIVVPGTWYDEAYWRRQGVLDRVSKTFGEQAVLWTKNWSGDNSIEARAKAAKELVNFINNYKFAPGEKLNIVAHSHGGNVSFLVSQSTSHKIDNLITLGTPIRSDYKPAENNIGQHLNVYSEHDEVQNHGGFSYVTTAYLGPGWGDHGKFVEGGPADRTINDPRVKNLNATEYTDSWSPMAAHSQLWERANLWEKVVVPEIKK